MTKSQVLNQFLRKVLHMSRDDNVQTSPESARRLSLSSSGSSPLSSQRSSWSSSRRLSIQSTVSDADFDSVCDDECWLSPPPDVPAGCLPVYVGEERRRFIIPTSYLSNSIFRALLAKSEEEYGLRCEGGLRIACPPDVFEHLLWSLQRETTCDLDEIERSCSGLSG